MDAISENRLKQVHPALAAKVRELARQLAVVGIYIRVVAGFRSVQEQDELYAKGRTAPGDRVTNCPGGHSYHNYGLAVDCCPSQYGPGQPFDPDWNEDHPAWRSMEELGISLGLDSGAHWRTIHDAPHFQLTGVLPEGSPPESALLAYQRGGIKAVWDLAKMTVADPPPPPAAASEVAA